MKDEQITADDLHLPAVDAVEEASMKERPILFSAPMVRAILDGKKTQTRRVVKMAGRAVDTRSDGTRCVARVTRSPQETSFTVPCPYGAPGDRLWVKETIRRVCMVGDKDCAVYVSDGSSVWLDTWPWERGVLSSIHMPRGLSRITLEVTGVRVERLHDITEDDARAEGVTVGEMQPATINGEPGQAMFFNARDAFAYLWAGINGADSWRANPWVWVVAFRRVNEQRKSEAA
jgi:hypothetical protein